MIATDPAPPYPSVADALYLSFYPASYTSLLLLARSRTDSFRSSLWLDGAIAALTIAALIATLAFQPIVDATSGGPAEIAVNLAYPVGDLLLLGLVVTVFGLNGWRPDPVWLLIGGGLALTAVADGLYLVQSATDQYVQGGLLDVAWPASALLVAVAAWQPSRRHITIRDWLIIAVPATCGLVAVQLLVFDHFERDVNDAGVSLAAWALLLALARMALAFLENQRSLTTSHAEARTDSLTGLRNRRCLLADLEVELGLATLASPRALLLFDLDGFKEYNDAFGHPAGDGLLVRLAARLAEAVGSDGCAYRLGGDEFCVLVSPGRDRVDAMLAACSGGAARARRGLRGHELVRCRRAAGGGRHADVRAPARRQAHVCAQGRPPDVRRAPVARRAAAHAVRAAAGPPRPPPRHRRAGARGRPRAAHGSRGAGRGGTCRRAPRRREDRRARRDPRQARPARPGRVELHAPAPADRRAHPAGGPCAAPGGAARALEPRALGRRRLPGRADRRRDPARGPRRRGLRRVRRHDRRAALSRAGERGRRRGRAPPLRRHAVRPDGRGGLLPRARPACPTLRSRKAAAGCR